jgi:integrase
MGRIKKINIQKGHQMNNLSHLKIDEIELICKLIESLSHIYPNQNPAGVVSDGTQNEYFTEAQRIFKKRKYNGHSISDSVNRTNKKSTFFKRISALKYYLSWIGSSAATTLSEKYCEDSIHNIKLVILDIAELQSVIETGFIGQHDKRKSKRSSINKLPKNWLEMLCNYNAASKYRMALLAMCLSACRPAELVKGVKISHSENSKINKSIIDFTIIGSKLSDTKGQPFRKISYDCNTSNELLRILIEATNLTEIKSITISIDSAVNFTTEIKRVSKILWPNHPENITSYSIRHQIASNFKRHLSGDDVSKALGHASLKTKKTYGSSGQSKGPAPDVSVSAAREINQSILKADEFNNN